MSNRNVASVILTALLVFSVLSVGATGSVVADSSLETTANEPLEDSGIHWQGHQLYNDTVANSNEILGLYDSDSESLVRNVTADESGSFVLDSTDLEGTYSLRNESNETVLEFQIVEQTVDFSSQNYYYVDNGTGTHVLDLEVDSNRVGGYDFTLKSDELNLTNRIDEAEEVNGTAVVSGSDLPVQVNLSGIEDSSDTYRIDGNVTDTTGEDNLTFQPSNFTHVEFERQLPTVEVVENGSYWGTHSLVYDHGQPDEELYLYSNGMYFDAVKTNQSGWATFGGEFDSGTYYIKNDTERLVNFSLVAQTVDASFEDDAVENGTGETNLSVASNRSDYDLLLWAENLSRATLNDAVPSATVTAEGDLVVQNLSADESLTLDYSDLSAGNYTLHVSSNDTMATSSASLRVKERSSKDGDGGGSDGGDDGSSGGGGGGGGNVPPPSVQVEVVEEGDRYLRAKITNARADSPASVSLPGFGAPNANFQQLDVAPESSDAQPRFFLNASVVSTPAVHAPSDVETLAYLHVNPTYVGNDELGEVAVRFRTATDSTDPETVELYRYVDGAWTSLDTEFVGERDGDYAFRATATGVSLFAVSVDDSEALGDDSGPATETQSTTEATTTTTTTTVERSAMESAETTITATPSSGPVGHDLSSVLVPLVAVLLALGARVRKR